MKFKIFTLLLFVTLLSFSQSKRMSTLSDVKAKSKSWSSLFLQGNYTQMFDEMKPYWPIPENKIEDMKSKTIQFKDAIRENYGEPIDIVLIGEENLQNVAFREVYFLRHERSTLRAIFTYYHNGKGWTLSSFEWDDSFSKEFAQEH